MPMQIDAEADNQEEDEEEKDEEPEEEEENHAKQTYTDVPRTKKRKIPV